MAVPIVFSSEDTEDSYRSLDFLLEQLLITLRQVLMIRRREAASTAQPNAVRHRHIPSEGSSLDGGASESTSQPEEATRVSPDEISQPSLPLPDLVLESSRGAQSEQKEIARTRTVAERSAEEVTQMAQTPPNWVQVGEDLQRIADQLLATNRLDQKDERTTSEIKSGDKDASLLSMLRPPLGGSVWTTVALLVGWGLLSRTR